MDYIATMRAQTAAALTELHRGVTELSYSDFPDYDNIGDSAIALGEQCFWNERGISVPHTSSYHATPPRLFRSERTVAIHGGGNFGGLYPSLWEHKLRLAEQLPASTLLIQEPQSVTFARDTDKRAFIDRMAPREQLRIAVRDHASRALLSPYIDDLTLSPDSAHMLGALDAPEPTRRRVVLARRDGESAVGSPVEDGIDWPRDPFDLRTHLWWSRRTKQLPAITPLFQHSTVAWMNRARRRFDVGVRLLAAGETIVTDRLHAMIIGLQLGRTVIAVENSNNKLRNYAETWLHDAGADVTFMSAERAFSAS